MTIAISLDSNTERLARKLADVTGKALPTIVKEAIEAQAKAARVAVIPVTADHLTRDQRLARLIDIAKGTMPCKQ